MALCRKTTHSTSNSSHLHQVCRTSAGFAQTRLHWSVRPVGSRDVLEHARVTATRALKGTEPNCTELSVPCWQRTCLKWPR